MRDDAWQQTLLAKVEEEVEKMGSARGAARNIGVNHENLRRFLETGKAPRGKDRQALRAWGGVASRGTVPASPTNISAVAPTQSLSVATPQTATAVPPFGSEGERNAYTLGVLHMAQAARGELGRCLDTATAALLAPVTGPDPTTDEVASIRSAVAARENSPHPPARRER